MLWDAEALGAAVAKRIVQWDRGLWTRQQALEGLLADLAFTLHEHPESRCVVGPVSHAARANGRRTVVNLLGRFLVGLGNALIVFGAVGCSSPTPPKSWGYNSGGPQSVVNDEPNYEVIALTRDGRSHAVLVAGGVGNSGSGAGTGRMPSGHWDSRHGIIDWRFSSPDDKGVKVAIGDREYDAAEGALFLVSGKTNPPQVEQLAIDPGQLQTMGASFDLSGLAKSDPRIAKFLETCRRSK